MWLLPACTTRVCLHFHLPCVWFFEFFFRMNLELGMWCNKYKVECKFIESMGDFHSIDSPIKCNLFGKYSFLRIYSLFSFSLLVAVLVVFAPSHRNWSSSYPYGRLASCCNSILHFVILIACAPSCSRNTCDFAFSALSIRTTRT